MATTAFFSDSFSIYVLLASAAAHNVANPGRSLRIMNIKVYNGTGTPDITVTKTGGTNISLGGAVATATNAWKDIPVDTTANTISTTDVITITNDDVSTTQVILECIAGTGSTNTWDSKETLTVT